jgi:ariadne-1
MSSDEEFSDTMDEDSNFDYQDQDFTFDATQSDPLEVDYKILKPQDILSKQQKEIMDVVSILGCEAEHASTLLRHFKWNKERLIESYMDNEEKVQKEAGVVLHKQPILKTLNFCCDICCNEDAQLETFALSCDHRFCIDCYQHYLTQKIKEEGESRHITCPGDCKLIVDEKTVEMLVEPSVYERL